MVLHRDSFALAQANSVREMAVWWMRFVVSEFRQGLEEILGGQGGPKKDVAAASPRDAKLVCMAIVTLPQVSRPAVLPAVESLEVSLRRLINTCEIRSSRTHPTMKREGGLTMHSCHPCSPDNAIALAMIP